MIKDAILAFILVIAIVAVAVSFVLAIVSTVYTFIEAYKGTNKNIQGKGKMKYRKKPVIIEAVQWTGDNYEEICNFTNISLKRDATQLYNGEPAVLIIPTLEGDHFVLIYDYIIKGVQGEFYPCKPDIFKDTYELVEE